MKKYRAITENYVAVKNNALVQSGQVSLFYCVNLYNYNVYSADSAARQIESLYNCLTSLETTLGTLSYSILRFDDLIPADEYKENFIRTIRLWDSEFVPSQSFLDNIKYNTQNYCFLVVKLDQNKVFDVDSMTVKEITKEVRDNIVDLFADFKEQSVNFDKIEATNKKIIDVGAGMLKPCPEDTLLSYYVRRVFPSYDIIMHREDIETSKTIISYLRQDITPHFNYFEMSNAGVETFGEKTKTTYGSVIDVIEFPQEIMTENYSLNYDSMVVSCKTLKKDEARVKIARQKRDIEYDEKSSFAAGAKDINYELEQCKDIAETALLVIQADRKVVEADVSILVLANSVEKLNKLRGQLISDLKNIGVLATFSPNQAIDYVNKFVKLRPTDYPFMMEMRYPLAFRQNNGVQIGDYDSPYTMPKIGSPASSYEARKR